MIVTSGMSGQDPASNAGLAGTSGAGTPVDGLPHDRSTPLDLLPVVPAVSPSRTPASRGDGISTRFALADAELPETLRREMAQAAAARRASL